MYREVAPWLNGRILEIGSGIGNISEFFLLDKQNITLTDIRQHYLAQLRDRFPELPPGRVLQMDLVDEDFSRKFAHLSGTFDSAFALNVIEHIEKDRLALKNLHSLLRPGGTFVMLVPAHALLYNRLDEHLHHFRRYSEKSARQLFEEAGFSIEHSWFFNSLGIPAWSWGGLSGNGEIRHSQMNLYNRLVPLIRALDRLTGRRIGLSVLVAGRKK